MPNDISIQSVHSESTNQPIRGFQLLICELERQATPRAATIMSPSDRHLIPLNDEETLQAYAEKAGFTYQHSQNQTVRQRGLANKLALQPVSIIDPGHRAYGVFATSPLLKKNYPINEPLAKYEGRLIFKSKLKTMTDLSYVFTLKENECAVDAMHVRNWTAFVNSTSCYADANIFSEIHPDESGHLAVYYYLNKDIKEGEQLLIYYGDDYQYGANNRFLKLTDNADESIDIFEKNHHYYLPYPTQIDPLLAELFNIDPEQHFTIPYIQRLCEFPPTNKQGLNLPALAYDRNYQLIVQNQQENITALMFACWDNHLPQVERLLKLGANPNIQTSIHGLSAVHLVVQSRLSYPDKLAMLDLLIKHHARLYLQDKNNHSVLYYAIKNNELDLVRYLLSNEKKSARKEELLLAGLDNDELDPFLYAARLNHHEIVHYLLPFLTSRFIVSSD